MDAGDWRLAGFVGLIFAMGLFCCFVRWYTENYLPWKYKQRAKQLAEAPSSEPKPLPPPPSLPTTSLFGVEYLIAANLEDVRRVVIAGKPLMYRFPTAQYVPTLQELSRFMRHRFGENSAEQSAVLTSPLVCPNCNTRFPDSWKALVAMDRGAASCPGCGQLEALLVLQIERPGDITAADVEALRQYWRHRALEWWKSKTISESQCSYSMTCDNIKQGAGYFCSGGIYCERCAQRRLDGALVELRQNPGYFGADELRLARQFVAEQKQTQQPVE